MTCQSINLPDGRNLSYAELGRTSAPAVLFCHGAPGSALGMPPELQRAFAAHHVLIPERPGYGGSDLALAQRRVRDWADDAIALLEALGVQQVHIVGYSGGGAFALACAHALGKRIDGVWLFSSIAPLHVPGMMQQMPALVAGLYAQAVADPEALIEQWNAMDLAPHQIVDAFLAETAAADKALARNPAVHRALTDDFERALSRGYAGWASDAQKLASPWGFDLADVKASVTLWHGTDDRNTPLAMGRYLARTLAHATLHEVPGHGHLLSFSDTIAQAPVLKTANQHM